mmetsp:Transcript_32689/g.70562  ORF Transcript_32689/g.70562 Transcript_32689/m.70562 type:complete len:253 (-) Transcript_32689:262-1020(-)
MPHIIPLTHGTRITILPLPVQIFANHLLVRFHIALYQLYRNASQTVIVLHVLPKLDRVDIRIPLPVGVAIVIDGPSEHPRIAMEGGVPRRPRRRNGANCGHCLGRCGGFQAFHIVFRVSLDQIAILIVPIAILVIRPPLPMSHVRPIGIVLPVRIHILIFVVSILYHRAVRIYTPYQISFLLIQPINIEVAITIVPPPNGIPFQIHPQHWIPLQCRFTVYNLILRQILPMTTLDRHTIIQNNGDDAIVDGES